MQTDRDIDGGSSQIVIRRLQHVSVPRPGGREGHDVAVAFYEGVLGLPEIPKPSTFTDIDVTWFRVGDSEIHVYAQEGEEPAPENGAHFCLVVADLAAARGRLERAGFSCAVPTEIPGRPRFNIRDPFGNGIEFTTIESEV